MDTLRTIDVVVDGLQKATRNFGFLNFPNYTFTFGKCYLLDGWPWHGGDTLSWLIGGVFDEFSGKLLKNELLYTLKERQEDAWCVRANEIKWHKFRFHEATVQEQIQYGLKTNSQPYFKSEQEFIEQFHLTIERYRRPLRQLSNEAWRASCAIGLANGRRVFCFPYVLPEVVNMNAEMHFKAMFRTLTNAGAMILLPTTAVGLFDPEGLFDEIVPVKHDSGDVVLYGWPLNS
jgi:hypothetical protein